MQADSPHSSLAILSEHTEARSSVDNKKVIVIGGGAAGMIAAITAAEAGCSVTLLEKNEKLGKKIYITGKGRCNYTNACDFNTFTENIVNNPKFMYSSLRSFMPEDMTKLLEAEGCRTKVERGNRAFPASDHASDVTAALQRRMRAMGVRVELNTEVADISAEQVADEMSGGTQSAKAAYDTAAQRNNTHSSSTGRAADAAVSIKTSDKAGYQAAGDCCKRYAVAARDVRTGRRALYAADGVIIATGGLSYPSTGSTGDGYRFAEQFGLKVTATKPALVPFEAKEADCRELQGVSLRNVSASISLENGKCIYDSEPGELLFTHFGLSGPLMLSASSLATGYLDGRAKLKLEIDLKPALSFEQLEQRILRDFEGALNTNIVNALSKLLIASLRPVILRRCGISSDKKVRDITKKERAALVHEIKAFAFTLTGTRGYNEAIITQGGVSVKEIDPKTMEVKKVPGLYFAGEVLDVDAYTGGFNLQIAWSTGHAAGLAAAGR